MAPDKIWVTTSEMTALLSERRHDYDVAYIRKDALLEWASRLKERWEEPPMSKNSPGCVFMLEQVIDKLKSM